VITLTMDLEDPNERYEPDGRYASMTRRILDLCEDLNRRATFFTIGRVAEAAPQLIRDIAARGHEIAFHSHAHVPLTEEDPARFRHESKTDKERLEQLAGKSVTGFRAPRFSLTPKSLWALDVLGELGFRYSSSIMPTNISLYGFPGAPRTPFLWPNGIIELPLPVAQCGLLRVPYLGGIYLYIMPLWLVRRWIAKADAREILWTYAHPYDFDREEKFTHFIGRDCSALRTTATAPMPHMAYWVSYLLWIMRRHAGNKIRNILEEGDASPLGERILPPASPKSFITFSSRS
jgi:peptidoglycan-N-acetylglucosamine deacetylase